MKYIIVATSEQMYDLHKIRDMIAEIKDFIEETSSEIPVDDLEKHLATLNDILKNTVNNWVMETKKS